MPEVPKKPVPEKKVAVAKREVAPPAKGTASFECSVLLYSFPNFSYVLNDECNLCVLCVKVCSHLRRSKALERLLLRLILIPFEFLKSLGKLCLKKKYMFLFPKENICMAKIHLLMECTLLVEFRFLLEFIFYI